MSTASEVKALIQVAHDGLRAALPFLGAEELQGLLDDANKLADMLIDAIAANGSVGGTLPSQVEAADVAADVAEAAKFGATDPKKP